MTLPFALSLVLLSPVQSDTLRVADPSLPALTLRVGTDTIDVYAGSGGERRLTVVYVQTVVETPQGYLVVERNERPSGEAMSIDSIAVARGTLATLWHADVTPAGRRHVAFENGRMRGVMVDSVGQKHEVDDAVPPGLFDYSLYSLVTSRIPLSAGYNVIVATWDIARGAQYVPLSVLGPETVDVRGRTHEAWRLDVELAPGWTVSRWVSRAEGRELRWQVKSQGREMVGEVR